MRVLVTGGAGFIGSHLVDALIETGDEVAVIDNLISGKRENLNTKAKFYQGDVKDYKLLEKVFAENKFDAVAHLAAQKSVTQSVKDPIFDAQENIVGSLNLFEACRQFSVKKVVFTSTGGALYGETDILPTPEDHHIEPEAPYGIAKFAVEHYLRFYAKTCQFCPVILRLANVYGPRQDPYGEAGVVAIFCQRIIEGKPVIVYGDGRQTRDYIFVGDVASCLHAALVSKTSGIYNIGTSVESTVLDLVNRLAEIAKKKVKTDFKMARLGELRRSSLDCQSAKTKGLLKDCLSLAKGLALTYQSFCASNKIASK